MADFTKSIGDQLRVLGPSATNKWGFINWGEKVWGAPSDPQFSLFKYIFDVSSISDSFGKMVKKVIGNSISQADDTKNIFLTDGSGYNYEFADRTTNADAREVITWAAGTNGSDSWAQSSTSQTTWGAST